MFLAFSLIWMCLGGPLAAQAPRTFTLSVDTQQPIATIQPNMYGIFFEDINFGADGGLYAELIKNRSFEFENPLVGWIPFGRVTIETQNPCFEKNPHYVRLQTTPESVRTTGTGLSNEGFRGIGLQEGKVYTLSFYARSNAGKAVVQVQAVDAQNNSRVTVEVPVTSAEWERYTANVTSDVTDAHAQLRLRLLQGEDVCLDHISLFPQDTWKQRPQGMRADLAQTLSDLHPGVFRFPGGCIVEGTTEATRYQWKNTVGPVENRPFNLNRWYYTFDYKFFPDYYQSYGLGFFEYFQLCEDFGADALPVLNCGMMCQYQDGPAVPLDRLQPYVDDALDLIAFANDPADTHWGSVRAQMGHPEPFGLKMIAIGNEQWGPGYPERLAVFVKAIRAKYPDIKIIGSSGPSAAGDKFDYLWPEMKRLEVDLVDEHYYMAPEWFFANAGRYDTYDRKGPKVFAGEFAAHDYPQGKANTFYAALSEAAFMTGLERNADVVHLATYAPLLAHKEAWQWNPDLIWFDNFSVVRTVNYYVQQLYAHYRGTHALATTCDGSDLRGENGLYATSCLDKDNNRLIVKMVNAHPEACNVNLQCLLGKGRKAYVPASEGSLITLQSSDLTAQNTFENPDLLVPVTRPLSVPGGDLTLSLAGYSFTVIVIPLK